MSADAGADASGGPMWGRFFESIGGGNDDTESAISGSNIPSGVNIGSHMDLHTPPPYPDSPFKPSPLSPEVHPNDSASVVDGDRGSDLGLGMPTIRRMDNGAVSSLVGSVPAPAPAVDDGTYVFKFTTPSKRAHRFQARHDDYEHLREVVLGKLEQDPFFAAYKPAAEDGSSPAEGANPTDFSIYYKDTDGDNVYISSSEDITDAVKSARSAGVDRVVLYLHGGASWGIKDEPSAGPASAATAAASASEPESKPDAVKEEIAAEDESPKSAPARPQAQQGRASAGTGAGAGDDIMGIPRDLLLPASIGALAVVIIAVFTISRFSD